MNGLWSLSVEAPEEVAETLLTLMPEGTVGQSAFRRDPEERGTNPLWVVQGLYLSEPEAREFFLELSILSTARKHAPYHVVLEQIPASGWIRKNEESYPPIRAGRIVIHARKDKPVSPHERGLELPIGAAFGTGEHPTTFGCLMALQFPSVLKRGMRVLDIGTGSGILALAAAKLAAIKAVASDNDLESVNVAQENVRRNGLRIRVRMEKADGFRSRVTAAKRPYDLILSNIFARPLGRLAPEMRRHLAPGGRVVLAGFLHCDAHRVMNAYAAQGLYLERRLNFGSWAILVLRRPVVGKAR